MVRESIEVFVRLCASAKRLVSEKGGNFAVIFALALVPLGISLSIALTYATEERSASELQQMLDAAVLAGASHDKDQTNYAKNHLEALLIASGEDTSDFKYDFKLNDDVLTGKAKSTVPLAFGGTFLTSPVQIGVISKAAMASKSNNGPCITVLGDEYQAALFNSGAGIAAPNCEMHIYSTKNPAAILNSGINLDLSRICMKGTSYINNGGSENTKVLETNCAVTADPYFQNIVEPTVPSSCTTSGAKDGTNHTLYPGRHCYVNFNGSPTITFKPGLHIIDGTMIINANSKVIADGVTFYFPNVWSYIQFNGGIEMEATAPTSGDWAGILMFEKTSDATNNSYKSNFVFNGTVKEHLEGAIYLPNRNVTYNSTSNINANAYQLYVYTLIVNSANWAITPGGSSSASASAGGPRLIQ